MSFQGAANSNSPYKQTPTKHTKEKEERVKVYVRCRPTDRNKSVHIHSNSISIQHPNYGKQYIYDGVFEDGCDQSGVYEKVGAPVVDHVLKGVNGICFDFFSNILGFCVYYFWDIKKILTSEYGGGSRQMPPVPKQAPIVYLY